MGQTVVIFGGNGFVGRAAIRLLRDQGCEVRVASRNPEAMAGVAAVTADICDYEQVRRAVSGADVVINCVGILEERGANGFDAVQANGAAHVAQAAADIEARLVHVSAIGANGESASAYARTKAQGEAAVQSHVPEAVILRPSIIFGPGDSFFNRFEEMSRFSPSIPLVGGNTKFQPVFVDDVAGAICLAVAGKADAGIYELGGPDVEDFRSLMARMLAQLGRKRLVINLPFAIGCAMGTSFDVLHKASFGLTPRPLTADQVANLRVDNVVSPDAKSFADLGLIPTPMAQVLPTYLGQKS